MLTTSGRRKRQRVALRVRVARFGSALESGRRGSGVGAAGEVESWWATGGFVVGSGVVSVRERRDDRR